MAPGSSFFLRIGASILVAGLVAVTAPTMPAVGLEADPTEVGRVAFVDWNDDVGREIFTMLPDGSDQRPATSNGGVLIGYRPDSEGELSALYTRNLDPEWTPDGSLLAYRHFAVDETWQIRLVDLGTGDDRVLFDDWAASMLSWSPDGRRIAYGDRQGVWVADADGTDADLVVESRRGLFPWISDGPETAAVVTTVRWSPDGSWIAFVESTHHGFVAGARFLSIVQADPPHQVVRLDSTTSGLAFDWAPDGDALVVGGIAEGLSIVDLTGARTALTDDWGEYPAWAPDGTGILYVTDRLLAYDIGAETAGVVDPDFGGTGLRWQHLRPHEQAVGLVDPATGVWRLPGTDGFIESFYYGNPGDIPFLGDWDCNGTATPGLFRKSDAYAYLRNHNSAGVADIRFFFGNPSDIPMAGDFNGDGCDTLSIYRPSDQRFYVINQLGADEGGLGSADYSFVFGDPGDTPVVGDWDGDGIDEPGLYRESTGFFYYRNSLTTGNADGTLFFGDPGDRFVAGDWGNPNGADTPAVFRPGDVTFYFRHTLDQGIADDWFTWVGADQDWLPVAGNP
ncbi:MAG: hypothetical protein R6W79_04580 [Acidimicrobiia bacterium]